MKTKLGGTCGKCGRENEIVNQCRCDPNNLPTRIAKHTPGPWKIGYGRSYRNEGIFDGGKVDRYGNHNLRLIESKANRIAKITESESWGPSQEEVDANARLIAAAPELLAVLERYVNWQEGKFDAIDIELEILNPARNAIAKATRE